VNCEVVRVCVEAGSILSAESVDHFCQGVSEAQGFVRPERLGKFKSYPCKRPWRPTGL
jgi:hypothetical protein